MGGRRNEGECTRSSGGDALGGTLPLQLGVNGARRCLVVAERPSGLSARAPRSTLGSSGAASGSGALECLSAQGKGGSARERERGERKGVEREKRKVHGLT